uniref:TNF receptor superfamily member 13B n=1 Tax=Mastacembelus armatus TaxID=205130 RepID=A0A3Q3RFR1_9TELE
MDGNCPERQYWDGLVKQCVNCDLVCKQPDEIPRCTSYCAANCKALPGHYYDGLLRKCVQCSEVCGRHPAECSTHCQMPTPPLTTTKLLDKVTSHRPNSRELSVPIALEDSTIVLYSLLALCMVLLVSSLSLALAIFPKRSRAKPSKPRPKEADHNQESVIQPGQEVGFPGCQLQQNSKGYSIRPTDREPSDDSIPTETCVCVHCFPDLKALGQGNDRPLRAPFTFCQQAVPSRAHMQTELSKCQKLIC